MKALSLCLIVVGIVSANLGLCAILLGAGALVGWKAGLFETM